MFRNIKNTILIILVRGIGDNEHDVHKYMLVLREQSLEQQNNGLKS